MQIYQLFKQAMDRHGIQGKELAGLAGISQNHLSQFRSGHKWVSPEVFAALLEGMDRLAPGSRKYFCQLLAEEPLAERDTSKRLAEMIEAADEDEMEAALLAIGRKWKRTRQNPAISGNYSTGFDSAIAV
ncbi:helix-turn-helix transcriptional regulator (plasmid) [Nostoc sp. UHCC 0926]|uniref:helix-turn-helix domain-containing protein n=1 Tax=Nostoc sp. UHCC 0926 TaxID=3025190 RepID=UPI00235F2412|nr:helix-turn-helix transcriptional regulator [Nostoc sp. UHCC 0926]WDD36117.1 helix-turn-helix transcriptional regulator [Nostoc sp. UHCC 0926]